MQTLHDATHWTRRDEETFEGAIEKSWGNGPAAFGGIVGAAFLRQMTRRLDFADHRLRTLEMHLCAPVFAEPTEMRVTLDRKGHSVSHLSARMTQSGNTCATANATFAEDREGAPTHQRMEMPDVPAPGEVPAAPEMPLTPDFAKNHYEYRFCIGDPPLSGSDTPVSGGWLRTTTAEAPHDHRQVACLMDCWPPSMFPTYQEFRRTVTSDIRYQFIEPPPALPDSKGNEEGEDAGDERFYLFRAEVKTAFDGYATEDAELWTEDGTLLARVQQMYTILD